MSDVDIPGKFFHPISEPTSPPNADEIIGNVQKQFAHNKDGDACAALMQLRAEVLAFEKANGGDTKAFVGALVDKISANPNFLAPLQIESVIFKNEIKNFAPGQGDKNQTQLKSRFDAEEQDQGISLLEQKLTAQMTSDTTPEKYVDLLEDLKAKYLHKKDVQSTSEPQNSSANSIPPEKSQKAQQAIEKLSNQIKEIHTDKGSWNEATALHDRGALESYIGSGDARTDLKKAIELIKQTDLAGQPQDPERSKALTQAYSDYADYLLKAKPGDSKDRVLADRLEANTTLLDLITTAPAAKLMPLDIADVYRRLGDNQVFVASDANKLDTAEGKTAYLAQMDQARIYFNKGIEALSSDNGNNSIASRALLTGDLAFAEASEANKPGDNYASMAEGDYQSALDLWKKYMPGAGSQDNAETERKTNSRDKAEIGLLAGYIKLLESEHKGQDVVAPLRQQLGDLLKRHPDFKVSENSDDSGSKNSSASEISSSELPNKPESKLPDSYQYDGS